MAHHVHRNSPMGEPVMLMRTWYYLYRYRNLVERFFNKIKHYRAVSTRYDKTPENFLAGVKLASLRIWMRSNESIT